MHRTLKGGMAVLLALLSTISISRATFFSYPRQLAVGVAKVKFNEPALAPFGHTLFCLRYPSDCQIRGGNAGPDSALTAERWRELKAINAVVNRAIRPTIGVGSVTEEWKISPASGNCHDYAVTKRHGLLTRGWRSRELLLAEVVVPWGTHHLVLVVRTRDADLVLDNLSLDIRTPALIPYQWVRVEIPSNPQFWSRVTVPKSLTPTLILERQP